MSEAGHNGNVLNERRFGALEASLTYLTFRVDELSRHLDKLEVKHDALDRGQEIHLSQLAQNKPYQRMEDLEAQMRALQNLKLPEIERLVRSLDAQNRDSATRGSFLKSQWTWLIAGISAGGTTIQLLQRFL